MDQSEEHKSNFSKKIANFYSLNKIKIYLLVLILVIFFITTFILKINTEKKNILIAEKYVKAGLMLTADDKNNAKLLYDEIILSKNKFYSILALNTIIEKNLIEDKNKILNYFDLIEETVSLKENIDIIKLKKALYLIKIFEVERGNNLLKSLIDQNSNLKPIAQELLKK
tara:strand:+ start:5934 stop:6443 length:510 start_codon:yes stop_codon:yes gene_type:complete